MKQEKKPLEFTRSALEKSQRATKRSSQFTRSLIEQSKKLSTPSTKVNKIGTAVGGVASAGLIFGGVVQVLIGKSLWGGGTLAAGCVALLSNRIHHRTISKRNENK